MAMSKDAACIFCRIISGAIPAHVVYQDDGVISFLDIQPVTPGHTLIIPERHYAGILETPDETVSLVFSRAKNIMRALKTALDADYVAVSVVGTDVPHFHVHLIPRSAKDGLTHFWSRSSYAEGEAARVASKIRESL